MNTTVYLLYACLRVAYNVKFNRSITSRRWRALENLLPLFPKIPVVFPLGEHRCISTCCFIFLMSRYSPRFYLAPRKRRWFPFCFIRLFQLYLLRQNLMELPCARHSELSSSKHAEFKSIHIYRNSIRTIYEFITKVSGKRVIINTIYVNIPKRTRTKQGCVSLRQCASLRHFFVKVTQQK